MQFTRLSFLYMLVTGNMQADRTGQRAIFTKSQFKALNRGRYKSFGSVGYGFVALRSRIIPIYFLPTSAEQRF
uniref:Putative secreted protein n=1 Tax=Ixodes ricinus TaxID=34613 RepID=A0A6B0UAA3_IXORI